MTTPAILPTDFYVYIHRRATTREVFYVGKGFRNSRGLNKQRGWRHANRTKYWKRIVGKHGLIVEIVQDGLQEWAAFELERDLIALYGRKDLGLGPLINATDGGDGGVNPGPEAREKHRKNLVARNKDPVWQTKAAAGRKAKGLSSTKRQAMSEKAKRQNQDPLFREKILSRYREVMADPVNRSKQLRGLASHTAKVKKPVRCVETGVVYESELAAAKALKVSAGNISNAVVGRKGTLTCGGYHWAYA